MKTVTGLDKSLGLPFRLACFKYKMSGGQAKQKFAKIK